MVSFAAASAASISLTAVSIDASPFSLFARPFTYSFIKSKDRFRLFRQLWFSAGLSFRAETASSTFESSARRASTSVSSAGVAVSVRPFSRESAMALRP